jgi:hypothetical protein
MDSEKQDKQRAIPSGDSKSVLVPDFDDDDFTPKYLNLINTVVSFTDGIAAP